MTAEALLAAIAVALCIDGAPEVRVADPAPLAVAGRVVALDLQVLRREKFETLWPRIAAEQRDGAITCYDLVPMSYPGAHMCHVYDILPEGTVFRRRLRRAEPIFAEHWLTCWPAPP